MYLSIHLKLVTAKQENLRINVETNLETIEDFRDELMLNGMIRVDRLETKRTDADGVFRILGRTPTIIPADGFLMIQTATIEFIEN